MNQLQSFNIFGVANVTDIRANLILTAVQSDGTSITRSAIVDVATPGIADGETKLLLIGATTDPKEPTCLVHVNGEFDARPLQKAIVKLLKQISHSIS